MAGSRQKIHGGKAWSRGRSAVSIAPRARQTVRRHEAALHLTRSRGRRQFFRVLELLHEYVPVNHPGVVYVNRQLSGCMGLCKLMDGRMYARKFSTRPNGHFYYIAISASLSEDQAIDTLVHEWAHAMAWPKVERKLFPSPLRRHIEHNERVAHGPEWGFAYSKAYTAFACDILPRIHREDRKQATAVAARKNLRAARWDSAGDRSLRSNRRHARRAAARETQHAAASARMLSRKLLRSSGA